MQAWALQKRLVADLLASGSTGHPAGHLLLLQHPPVFTLGSGSSLEHLRFDPAAPPHPLHRTERGGEVTYHGPGQLVAYPILNLRAFQPDLHWYLRALEEVVIRCVGAHVAAPHAHPCSGMPTMHTDCCMTGCST
jgi:lipoyl(octanoyl) transferase